MQFFPFQRIWQDRKNCWGKTTFSIPRTSFLRRIHIGQKRFLQRRLWRSTGLFWPFKRGLCADCHSARWKKSLNLKLLHIKFFLVFLTFCLPVCLSAVCLSVCLSVSMCSRIYLLAWVWQMHIFVIDMLGQGRLDHFSHIINIKTWQIYQTCVRTFNIRQTCIR